MTDWYPGITDDANFRDLKKLGGFPDDETDGTLYVSPSGKDTNSGASPRAAKKTLESLIVAAGTSWDGRVVASRGTHEVGDGLDLSGYNLHIVGLGPETMIKASSQTGPVLKFNVGLASANQLGVPDVGGFRVRGSGVAGTAKHGIEINGASAIHLRDIGIADCGGSPLKLANTWGSTFENITLGRPVSANANDVPYVRASGFVNGNTFAHIGLRALSTDGEGASGAVIFEDDGTYAPTENLLVGWWTEYLWLPTNGCVLSMQGNVNIVDGWRFFDTGKKSGATGTAYYRLLKITTTPDTDIGGNQIRGLIPGHGIEATNIDVGVVVSQSRNRIDGVKGYNGANVVLNSGCDYTTVILAGGQSGVAGTSGVTDNSGATHNAIIDLMNGTAYLPGRLRAGSLGVGNSASATTLGTVTKKVEVFDASGTSLGYVPIYDAIS